MNLINTLVPVDGELLKYVSDGKGGLQLVRVVAMQNAEAGGAQSLTSQSQPSNEGASKRLRSPDPGPLSDNDDDDDDDDDDEDDDEQPQLKKKKAVWNQTEVGVLLDLCIKHNIVDKRDGKMGHLPHHKLFKKLAEDHNKSKVGEPKSWKQVRTKFLKLKNLATSVKKHNSKSGEGRRDAMHLDKMKVLFGNRPNATMPDSCGYESQETAKDQNSDPASNGASSSNKSPAATGRRYRSGKPNATLSYLQAMNEQEEAKMEKFQQRTEEQLQRMQAADAQLLENISNNFMTGLQQIAAMLVQPSASAAPVALPSGHQQVQYPQLLQQQVQSPNVQVLSSAAPAVHHQQPQCSQILMRAPNLSPPPQQAMTISSNAQSVSTPFKVIALNGQSTSRRINIPFNQIPKQ